MTESFEDYFNLVVFVQGLKTAVVEGHDIGGTCVNRGCVPSKALLAASGRVRELQNEMHMKALGIQVSALADSLATHQNPPTHARSGIQQVRIRTYSKDIITRLPVQKKRWGTGTGAFRWCSKQRQYTTTFQGGGMHPRSALCDGFPECRLGA